MIDKLEVGIAYKLVNKAGYVNNHSRNAEFVERFLTNSGCFIFEKINEDGSGVINDHVVLDVSTDEHLFLSKVGDVEMEYRVIRKATKHQVCDWRKGVRLYEDEFGTLVRNDKRTKFYTDIVEWREVEKPVTLEDIANKLDSLNLPFSDKGREELIEMAAKYKQSNGGK